MLGFSPIFEVFSGPPTGLTQVISGTANRPNINKRPGAKFGKNSLNYSDLWHFSPPYIRHTHPPDPTLESASPFPPQGSIWHRFDIDSTSKLGRIRKSMSNQCRIDAESTPEEGRARRIREWGLGGAVPNKPLTSPTT